MPNPIEWREADRVETRHLPGANARLVVRRTRAPGSHPDGTPRAVCRVDDATTADLASALDALPAGERSRVLKAFGADPEMRAALLADCAVAHGRAAVSEAVANETRKARVAAEAERDDAREELDRVEAELDARTNETDALALKVIATEQARDAARFERDALRTELRAREWLDAKGCASRPVFVGRDCVTFAYASYAGAARALGWEG